MSTTKTTRVYTVTVGNTVRLVKAQNRIQALSHVANSILSVRIASQDDLINAVSSGVQVETANEDQHTGDVFESAGAAASE